jgi:uncharacterized protein
MSVRAPAPTGGRSPTPVPAVSAELFTIPLYSDRYLVYAPLRRAAFVTNASAVNVLADLGAGRSAAEAPPDRALVEFLRRLEILDAGPEVVPVTTFTGPPAATAVTLFLTTACNLRCTYCYASAGDTPARYLPLRVARQAIDFVAANAVRKGGATFEINYHGGGEPSAHWRVLTGSLAYGRATAARHGLAPPLASAATNGVLRDDQIDWIVANLAGGVTVSFDGLPSVHDRHRVTALGRGSSARVMHTLRRFDAARYPYGIRLTVTRDEIPQLPDSVGFIATRFAAARIQVEPAYQLGRWRGAPSAETEEFIAAYRLAQARAAEHGREVSFSTARLGPLSNHFCGVTQDTFALTPDGNVSACYEVFSDDHPLAGIFRYGRPAPAGRGYEFDLPVLEHLRGQAVEHRTFCRGCFAKWTCAGDCYHKAVSVTGELEFVGTDRCHITRELTKDLLLARIAAAGGVFWHAAPGEDAVPAADKEGAR